MIGNSPVLTGKRKANGYVTPSAMNMNSVNGQVNCSVHRVLCQRAGRAYIGNIENCNRKEVPLISNCVQFGSRMAGAMGKNCF